MAEHVSDPWFEDLLERFDVQATGVVDARDDGVYLWVRLAGGRYERVTRQQGPESVPWRTHRADGWLDRAMRDVTSYLQPSGAASVVLAFRDGGDGGGAFLQHCVDILSRLAVPVRHPIKLFSLTRNGIGPRFEGPAEYRPPAASLVSSTDGRSQATAAPMAEHVSDPWFEKLLERFDVQATGVVDARDDGVYLWVRLAGGRYERVTRQQSLESVPWRIDRADGWLDRAMRGVTSYLQPSGAAAVVLAFRDGEDGGGAFLQHCVDILSRLAVPVRHPIKLFSLTRNGIGPRFEGPAEYRPPAASLVSSTDGRSQATAAPVAPGGERAVAAPGSREAVSLAHADGVPVGAPWVLWSRLDLAPIHGTSIYRLLRLVPSAPGAVSTLELARALSDGSASLCDVRSIYAELRALEGTGVAITLPGASAHAPAGECYLKRYYNAPTVAYSLDEYLALRWSCYRPGQLIPPRSEHPLVGSAARCARGNSYVRRCLHLCADVVAELTNRSGFVLSVGDVLRVVTALREAGVEPVPLSEVRRRKLA